MGKGNLAQGREGGKKGENKKNRERERESAKNTNQRKEKQGELEQRRKKGTQRGRNTKKSQGNGQIQGRVRHKDIERDKKIKGGNTRTSTKETKKTSRK